MKTLTTCQKTVENALSNFNGYFESFFEDMSPTARILHYSPAVNIQETENSYVMEMELPGFDEKNIEVNVGGSSLTISSRPEEKKNKENGSCILREKRKSAFYRSFMLPDNADPEAVSAAFKNGILKLNIKKRAKTQKRTIQINAA